MEKTDMDARELEPCLVDAVLRMEKFVEEVTGQRPTPEELAGAMTKYFVLKEMVEYIQMGWEENLDIS